MSSPLPAAPHADQPTRRWPLLEARYWLSLLAVSTGITGFLLLINRLDPWLTFVHTTSITVGCALSIQAGLNLGVRVSGERRPGWPSWPWTVVALLLGTLVGYTLGSLLGNLLTGRSVQTPLSGLSRETLGSLAFALIPGSIIVWYFHTRERLVAAEARAQAAQRLAAENQLRLLQTQLEPHMLFNTLANLRVLIALDAPRAQAMLDRLIAFLRATLNASRQPLHALSEEFASVDDYLALMSVRMAARLQTRLDLPPELADVPVPPLLLQPLVENAIKHGLEPQVAGGRIDDLVLVKYREQVVSAASTCAPDARARACSCRCAIPAPAWALRRPMARASAWARCASGCRRCTGRPPACRSSRPPMPKAARWSA